MEAFAQLFIVPSIQAWCIWVPYTVRFASTHFVSTFGSIYKGRCSGWWLSSAELSTCLDHACLPSERLAILLEAYFCGEFVLSLNAHHRIDGRDRIVVHHGVRHGRGLFSIGRRRFQILTIQ